MTITIRPIQPGEAGAAKALIVAVAQPMFAPHLTAAEFGARLDEDSFFYDVDHHDEVYGPPDGLFLVALDGETLIGTGAIRRLDGTTAELRRLWLREAYHGQGIGFRLTQDLLAFARLRHYHTVRLMTDGIQGRAIAFYQKVGFHIAGVDGANVSMEMALAS